MRRPSLPRWLRRELIELSGEQGFSMRKLAARAQGNCPRAAEPLLLYAVVVGRTEELLGLVYNPAIRSSYEGALASIGQIDIEEAARSGRPIPGLERDYAKHLASFHAEYRRPEARAESKRLRWERSHALQLEKGISNAQVSRALGLNPGNVNAYLKNADLGKVSLENATAIMRYLATA